VAKVPLVPNRIGATPFGRSREAQVRMLYRLAEGLAASLEAADLRVGNFVRLPWEDRTFDVVIDIQAIVHNTMPVIRSVMSEIARVLKPGGWFFARMFGPKTTGIMTGIMVEDRTVRYSEFGPMVGCGLLHAFTEEGDHKTVVFVPRRQP